MSFIDKTVSVKKVISILAKNGVQVEDSEAGIILDFLYIIARNHNKNESSQNALNLKESLNLEKMA
jgi:predicted amino acid-binding ACT domain protein